MENDMIEEPVPWPDLDDRQYLQENPMKEARESYEIRGPFANGTGKWIYQLWNDRGEVVADVISRSQQEALVNALELAAAPRMADALEDIAIAMTQHVYPPLVAEYGEAWQESQGIACEACDTLGQPSRMVFGTTGRAYHPVCVPESVKRGIAQEGKAADGDVPF